MDEIKKILIGDKEYHIRGTISINWDNTSDMNNFTTSGVYVCEDGVRTNTNDNLPIANSGGGHNFSFVLQVSASSYTETAIVGQTLSLSNRYGGETKQYIRTYLLTGWTPWQETTGVKILGNAGQVDRATLDNTTEWGEYTGVLYDYNWFNSPYEKTVLERLYNALNDNDTAKLFGSSTSNAAFNCNLLGATFKMSVFHNSSFLSSFRASLPPNEYGNTSNIQLLVGDLGKIIVQKLDVIPFNPFSNAQEDYFEDLFKARLQPRTIIRYGNQFEGRTKWSPFYETDGHPSNLQMN